MLKPSYAKQTTYAHNNSRAHPQLEAKNKHIYQMHYVPKLTEQILADSDITENGALQDQSSRYQQIVDKWGAVIKEHKQPYPKDDRRMQAILKEKITIAEGGMDLGNLAMKIRCGIQYFITSIANQQPISPKLQFAIENLLLHMLNIANALSSLASPTPLANTAKSQRVKPSPAKPNVYSQNMGYYKDEYDEQQEVKEKYRKERCTVGNIKIEDNENEEEQEGEGEPERENSSDRFVIAEQSSSREESMEAGDINVQAFDNTNSQCSDGRQSSQYYHSTSNEAILQFLDINKGNQIKANQSTSKHSSRKPAYAMYQESYRVGSQICVDDDQAYTQNESEIGVEEPSSTSILLPENFVKKCQYYSGSCQPRAGQHPARNQYPLRQAKANMDDSIPENSDIECSISEYYIEQSPCSKASKKSNKENKYPISNGHNHGKESWAKNSNGHSNHEQKWKMSRGKEESRYEGYTYSEVISRKKIF